MSNTDAVVETIVSSDDTVRVEVVDQEKAAVSKHEPKPDPLDAEKVELLSNGWANSTHESLDSCTRICSGT